MEDANTPVTTQTSPRTSREVQYTPKQPSQSPVKSKDKGKQRQFQFVEHLSIEDTDQAFASGSSDNDHSPTAYPPAHDELAETRRIEAVRQI